MKYIMWVAAILCLIGAGMNFAANKPIDSTDYTIQRAQALIANTPDPPAPNWMPAVVPSVALVFMSLILATGGSILHRMDAKKE